MPIDRHKYRARLPEPNQLDSQFRRQTAEVPLDRETAIRYLNDLVKTLRLRHESTEGDIDTVIEEVNTININGSLLAFTTIVAPAAPPATTFDVDVTTDYAVYLTDVTDNDVEYFLMPAAEVEGRTFHFKKILGGNTITITPDGSETIDGDPNHVNAGVAKANLVIMSDGSNWHILNQFP